MPPAKAAKAASNGIAKTSLTDLHAARRELTGQGPVVEVGGVDYHLPAILPATVLVGLGDVQAGHLSGLRDAIGALFGVDNVDAVLAAGLEFDDLEVILGLYDDAHFSPASGGSS